MVYCVKGHRPGGESPAVGDEKRMRFKEFKPSSRLAKFVKCFWVIDGMGRPQLHPPERIVPDACMEVIFAYTGSMKRYYHDHSSETFQSTLFLTGQMTRYSYVQVSGNVGMVGARFYPDGVYPFFGVPVGEFNDKIISLNSLLGIRGKEIENRMLDAKTNEQRVRLLHDFLLDQLGKSLVRNRSGHEMVNHAINLLRTNPCLSIEALASQLYVSDRQLERKFSEVVGMTPKLLSRMERFLNVFKIVRSHHVENLTALAVEVGYYDQAHFIHEFKNFTGLNPKAYLNERHRIADFYTIDDLSDSYNHS